MRLLEDAVEADGMHTRALNDLAVLHIRNRHSHLSAFLPAAKLGWLGGLLKPQPSENFKRKSLKGRSPKASAKRISR